VMLSQPIESGKQHYDVASAALSSRLGRESRIPSDQGSLVELVSKQAAPLSVALSLP
jgi:hypothetical protein